MAYNVWRFQLTEADCPTPIVFAWGGGVSLAQLHLAKFYGATTCLIASHPERLEQCTKLGITPLDRGLFPHLQYDKEKYTSDLPYKKSYIRSEKTFLEKVKEITQGKEISIFIDHIGEPVYRVTLKALGRQGVITTAGWKHGMKTQLARATECIRRHQHIHTHGARFSEAVAATHFAENTDWMAPVEEKIHPWNEIPTLADEYRNGKLSSYFPIFQINQE